MTPSKGTPGHGLSILYCTFLMQFRLSFCGSYGYVRGDILNLNLMDLAGSLKFPIILDVDSGETFIFDVGHREHDPNGTLFFTK